MRTKINGIASAVAANAVAQAGQQAAINWSATVNDALTTASEFVRSCEGNCWMMFPPFSGKGAQRGECIKQCKQMAYTQTTGSSQAGFGNLLKIGLPVAALVYIASQPKTKKRRK